LGKNIALVIHDSYVTKASLHNDGDSNPYPLKIVDRFSPPHRRGLEIEDWDFLLRQIALGDTCQYCSSNLVLGYAPGSIKEKKCECIIAVLQDILFQEILLCKNYPPPPIY
jgi:hypothetical protein